MNDSVLGCRICGLIQRVGPLPPGQVAACPRCGSVVARAAAHGLRRTAALSLAALALYAPANVYPVLRMEFHGVFTESTVWDGCARLFQDGEWLVAGIVFVASLVVPLLKLLGLLFLVISTKLHSPQARLARTWICRWIELVGPWAMLDVFLAAILVALVKLGRIATVAPGPGLLAFASVVVLTILASATFDPKQIWDGEQGQA